jgi:hypothetical protein
LGKEVVFPGRGRRPIAGRDIQEKVYAELAEPVKGDGPEPCNNADYKKIDGPFPGVGEVKGTPAISIMNAGPSFLF